MSADHEIHLERMAWPDVQAALEAGRTTAVVACGAVEQHGPHLPLLVDAEHGTRLAEEVARRLGDALVAPTIRIGVSEHHMAFPGSLTLRRSTFEAVCTDYATSLARHGFRTVAFVPTHGGNYAPLEEMLPRLREAVGDTSRVVAYTDLLELVGVWREAAEAVAGLGDRVGGHADVAEGSLMLEIVPELVRPERAEVGYAPELTREGIDRIIRDGFRSVTPNGILGDGRGLDAAIGRRCLEALADRVAAFIREARAA